MNYFADKQTLEDLNISAKYKPDSIFSFFNKVRTSGGEKLMQHMFQHPLNDEAAINKRSALIRCFYDAGHDFPFELDELEIAINYLTVNGENSGLSSFAELCKLKILKHTLHDERYAAMEKGLICAVNVLKKLQDFLYVLQKGNGVLSEEIKVILPVFSNSAFSKILSANTSTLGIIKQAQYDYTLRNTLYEEIRKLIDFIFHIDLYITIAEVARANNLSYAHALPKSKYLLHLSGVRHPILVNGIGNSIGFDVNKNALFLTGANMAGKSTFMKSIGVAVYLAHMGFPVAAEEMVFSIRDGIYSSINVSDNLNLGYSHFYAEVLRVKQVATAVADGKEVLVLFDELFKGTNVKDAYDATLAVVIGFVKYRRCFFVISTHIIEVGAIFSEQYKNVQINYFPTIMNGKTPRYTYRLEEGISSDRLGMIILENEGVLNMIINR